MKDESAILVEDVSKMYKLYTHPSDLFWEMVKGKPRYKPFWALRGISFEVKRGQVVGILGRNGAGKSTLLKLITGTLDKTSGNLRVRGRISSILELGTGFTPEYTGRENIYIGGLMVGMTRAEIARKMDWIIEFSELEDFIDQPFKTYSTGMQARLTFSTAVCIEPDVLIIDEALAVGDAKFQRKSFGKIEEFRKEGRTILLVSHDINTVSTFCDHAILLECGRLIEQGEPFRIGQIYYKMLFGSEERKQQALPTIVETKQVTNDAEREITLDPGKIMKENGRAWWIDLSGFAIEGDTTGEPQRSEYVLCEDNIPLRPGHCAHDQIRSYGNGAYSHWGKSLYFSSCDNRDPRTNRRSYRLIHKDNLKTLQKSLGAIKDKAQLSEIQDRKALREQALKILGLREAFNQNNPHQMRVGNGKAEILDYGILDEQGDRTTFLVSGKKYTFFLRAVYYEDLKAATFGFAIQSLKGVDMWGVTTMSQKMDSPPRKKGDIVEARVVLTMWLTNGIYFLTVGTADPNAESDVQYDLRSDGFQFEVGMKEGIFTTSIVDLCVEKMVIERLR
jgi:ABC-type polysaccharide/polyol phosphate transport system ATPase subunit